MYRPFWCLGIFREPFSRPVLRPDDACLRRHELFLAPMAFQLEGSANPFIPLPRCQGPAQQRMEAPLGPFPFCRLESHVFNGIRRSVRNRRRSASIFRFFYPWPCSLLPELQHL